MTDEAGADAQIPQYLKVPGLDQPLHLDLPGPLAALRQRALDRQAEPPAGIPEIELADARSWAGHTPEEDWLVWRARRTHERLRCLPLHLEPGEPVVGKPLFRLPTTAEEPLLAEARATLATMPPFPGGDAGHFHPDYEKLFRVGISGLQDEVRAHAQGPGLDAQQQAFYAACALVLEGLSLFLVRTAQACDDMAAVHAGDAEHWQALAAACRHVSTQPPQTFREALQLLFSTLIALWFGEDHGLTSPGRLDQTLRPFYEADRAAGRITPQQALEHLDGLYIQMNRILHPGSANSVMLGGRDRGGADASCELTYLCLAARLATRLVYPTVGLAWHQGTPRELLDFAVDLLATGLGDPALFNDEVITAGLQDHGVRPEDAHNYVNSTCVEIKVAGASHMWVTAPYVNLPKALLEVLDGVASGALPVPQTFAELQDRVRQNVAATVRRAAMDLDRVWHERGRTGGFPLASCLIADCLAQGKDFDRGGARYNWVENSFVGLANLVDGLLAVDHLVFRTKELDLAELHGVLQRNFAGQEALRQRILSVVPHYGNDDEEADTLAADWAEQLIRTTQGNRVGLHSYVPGFFCWVMHEHFGQDTGATPDGRLAGWPLADGAGAAQGRERCGPTAAVLSTTRWSHRAVLGGLVHNAKFSRNQLQRPGGRRAVRQVIETYLRRGGFEIQVNVVSREDLLDAQVHPERHRDLLVRVAGYSDYFVHLNRNMQEEVLARTEFAL